MTRRHISVDAIQDRIAKVIHKEENLDDDGAVFTVVFSSEEDESIEQGHMQVTIETDDANIYKRYVIGNDYYLSFTEKEMIPKIVDKAKAN